MDWNLECGESLHSETYAERGISIFLEGTLYDGK